MSCDAEDM